MKKDFVFLNQSLAIDEFMLPQFTIAILEQKDEQESTISFVQLKKRVILPNSLITKFNPQKTGDGYSKKVCNVCHRLLDTKKFSKNQNGKNNRTIRRPSCNDCRENIDGVNLKSKEKIKWQKVKPYMEIFECPICSKRTIPGLTSKVVLDHNHKDGSARGWICDSCNTGIGRFKDDVNLLQRAIQFLEPNQKG